ncbi:hypothetical protein C8Q75DRAFT_728558, partial [Abortiporus biennis]
HCVHMAWNMIAVKQHCSNLKMQMFISPAYDSINQHLLTLMQRYLSALHKGRETQGDTEQAALPNSIEFGKEVKVIVTFNVQTDLNIVNGV